MKKIDNIEKSILEIGQLLAGNSQIVQLLYNDTPNALNEEVPSLSVNDLINQKYICLYPPVFDAVDNNSRNTYCILLLDAINFAQQDNNIGATYTLYITTDDAHILLNNNQNRLLKLLNLITQTLDNQKLTASGTINLSSASHVMLSNFRAGYRIRFSITDSMTRKAEI